MENRNYILELQEKIFSDILGQDYNFKKHILNEESKVFKKMLKAYNLAEEGDVVVAITSDNYDSDGNKFYHGVNSKLIKGEKYKVRKVYARNSELKFHYVASLIDESGVENDSRLADIRIHPDSVRKENSIRFRDVPFLEGLEDPKSYIKDESGEIYIMKEGDYEIYKIGFSTNVNKRKNGAQSNNSRDFKIISTFPSENMREDEKKIKRAAVDFHIVHEFYGPEVKGVVKNIMGQ